MTLLCRIASLLITGATGYLGRPLTALALARRHEVRVFIRRGSESRVAPGASIVVGNLLSADEIAAVLSPRDTLVHLVGTPRPSPAKAQQFLDVDLASIRAAAAAAARVAIRHIVYVSVAHPAPVMKAYIDARREGEALVRASGIPATILRPWYVLGPGHRWAYALVPLYRVFELIPSKRETALRLGLVTERQMIAALMRAVEDGPEAAGVWDVPRIRAARI